MATDIDGRRAQFELPLIFMDNTMASPRNLVNGKLLPDYDAAEVNADDRAAPNGWPTARAPAGALRSSSASASRWHPA